MTTTASSRLRKDFVRLAKDPIPHVQAAPNRSNILEWHYVIEGPPDSPYHGGFYHGKLIFPSDYPFKPPSIYILTPNGRFKTNYRLCLSISDYHPDTWNPAWSVGTILTGLLSFMLESSETLGSLVTSDYEKRKMARESLEFNLKNPTFCALFPELTRKLKDILASEQSNQSPVNNDTMISVDSQVSSRLLSNLLILGGLLTLVAIGKYIFQSTMADF
uniref:Ubiquitin-conjugating enzyme E2 J2 n=1 Tax=Romanomermis culicivorax TaxID=13658 RepID=A0A915IAB8_ROMCU